MNADDFFDDDGHAVDGFTWADIRDFVFDSVVQARCTSCQAEHDVEPDARSYTCQSCGTPGTVTSPLVKLGIV